jgi:DNA repair protein RAD51
MIETGLKKLDQFLGGGIKDGLITSISGQNATGKTQLAFQICLGALHNGKEILFQDTTGEFRPERLVEMMQSRKINPSLLDKIKVNRVTNTVQQINYLLKAPPENYSLIVVDSVTDLFSFEYSKKEQSLEKHITFMKYMHSLSSIAINSKIPIIVTNIVRTINNQEKENLEESISMYIHTKIKLSKNNNVYSCEAIYLSDNKKFQYTITSNGLAGES